MLTINSPAFLVSIKRKKENKIFELITLLVVVLYYVGQIIFDYWSFYKLSKIKFKLKDLCLIAYFILGFVLTLSNFWWGSLVSVGEIILFYTWFRKRGNQKEILLSILLITVIDMLQEILFELLEEDTNNSVITLSITVIMIGLLIAIGGVINHFLPEIQKRLFNKNDSSLIYILAYLYLSMQGWYVLVTLQKNKNLMGFYLISEIILQLTFVIITYYFYQKLTKKLLDRRKQKQIQQHLKDTEEYAAYLEQEYKNNQKLRHDLNNLLLSLKDSNTSSVDELSAYLKEKFPENNGKNYVELKNIKIKELKNLLITKFAKMNQLRIRWSFECKNEVTSLPNGVNLFDIVRIIGIALDNAIEASKGCEEPFIQIMIFSEENLFEFEVRNNFSGEGNIKLFEKEGWTSKKDHLGIGLSNIKEIVAKSQEMTLDIEVQKKIFDFYLVVESNENTNYDL